ncbi:MAG: hypothetical protein ACJ8GJ_14970 [Vitreoscilla sp.]
MHTNNLYRGLFELLTLPQDGDASMPSLATTQGGRRELLSVARMEGCLPELYARWAPAGLLSPSESVEHDQLGRRRAASAEVLQVLPRGTLVADIDSARRGSSTLEVLLPDFAAIAPLHEAVGRLGYRLQGAGEWLVPPRGPMHRGFAAFHYGRPASAGGAVSIEVQVGGVALGPRGHLPFAELAGAAPRLAGSACRTLEPTRELLHRIASLGARAEPVTVRQVADLHLLLKSSAHRIDFAWLNARVEHLQAWAGLRQIRDAIAAKRLGALLSWGQFGRLIEAGVAHGEAVAARRKRSPRLGALVKSAFDTLQPVRDDDIAAKLARAPWLVSRVLEAGHRVRGVPVSTKTFDAPRFVRIEGALYLATGAGLMLLSLVDLRDGARAALGERVRTGRRPVVLARWTAGRARAGTR